MAELVNLDEASTSRQLWQVCALPAVVRALITHARSPRASALPFHAGRLWSDSFDGGSSRCVVATCGPSVAAVAVAEHMEHAGLCHASLLRGYARVVLAATVWPPQLLSMSSTAHAVTRSCCLRYPTDRTV